MAAEKPAELEREIWNANEVAAYLRIKRRSVYALCSNGELPYFKVGPRLIRFDADEIRALKHIKIHEVPAQDEG